MKFGVSRVTPHGLRAQVLLWTILPLTILLVVFSLTGVSSHQNSMHTLVVEEKTKLVVALARTIAVQLENYALRSQTNPKRVPIRALNLDQLLVIEHSDVPATVALLDPDGQVLYRSGPSPTGGQIGNWPGVSETRSGESGVLFAAESTDDIIAYAPVPGTDWVLVIREPWHSLTVPLLRFEQVMPIVLLGAVIVSFLTLFFGLHYIVRPLRAVGVQAHRIGQGDFGAAAESVGGVQEIEDLRQILDQTAYQLQQHQAALQDYLRAVTQAQEEERSRLSRDLHDETVQTLIALGYKAEMAQRSLRPLYLEELGLTPALEMLAHDAEASFHVTGSPQRLSAEQELALYRIAQESLNNTLHHSQASNIQVEFQFGETEVTLTVCDDGIGFETPVCFNHLTQTGHFGLMGMHERAQLARGKLTVTSALERGTSIIVTIDSRPNRPFSRYIVSDRIRSPSSPQKVNSIKAI